MYYLTVKKIYYQRFLKSFFLQIFFINLCGNSVFAWIHFFIKLVLIFFSDSQLSYSYIPKINSLILKNIVHYYTYQMLSSFIAKQLLNFLFIKLVLYNWPFQWIRPLSFKKWPMLISLIFWNLIIKNLHLFWVLNILIDHDFF